MPQGIVEKHTVCPKCGRKLRAKTKIEFCGTRREFNCPHCHARLAITIPLPQPDSPEAKLKEERREKLKKQANEIIQDFLDGFKL